MMTTRSNSCKDFISLKKPTLFWKKNSGKIYLIQGTRIFRNFKKSCNILIKLNLKLMRSSKKSRNFNLVIFKIKMPKTIKLKIKSKRRQWTLSLNIRCCRSQIHYRQIDLSWLRKLSIIDKIILKINKFLTLTKERWIIKKMMIWAKSTITLNKFKYQIWIYKNLFKITLTEISILKISSTRVKAKIKLMTKFNRNLNKGMRTPGKRMVTVKRMLNPFLNWKSFNRKWILNLKSSWVLVTRLKRLCWTRKR